MTGALDTMVSTADVAIASGGKIRQADPRLPSLIRAAQAAVQTWCGWHIAPIITETVTLDGNGGRAIQLPSGRVVAIDSVQAGGVEWDPAQYGWSQAGMLESYGPAFPRRFRSVRVTMRHGYEEAPAVASVITQAVLGACASPMGATREQAGQVAVSWARTGLKLDGDDMAALAPYRLQSWA